MIKIGGSTLDPYPTAPAVGVQQDDDDEDKDHQHEEEYLQVRDGDLGYPPRI